MLASGVAVQDLHKENLDRDNRSERRFVPLHANIAARLSEIACGESSSVQFCLKHLRISVILHMGGASKLRVELLNNSNTQRLRLSSRRQ